MLRIFLNHPSRTSLLQDFAFYEVTLFALTDRLALTCSCFHSCKRSNARFRRQNSHRRTSSVLLTLSLRRSNLPLPSRSTGRSASSPRPS